MHRYFPTPGAEASDTQAGLRSVLVGSTAKTRPKCGEMACSGHTRRNATRDILQAAAKAGRCKRSGWSGKAVLMDDTPRRTHEKHHAKGRALPAEHPCPTWAPGARRCLKSTPVPHGHRGQLKVISGVFVRCRLSGVALESWTGTSEDHPSPTLMTGPMFAKTTADRTSGRPPV